MLKTKNYLVVMIFMLLAALSAFSLLGSYTRMHADDFCIAADARQMDLVSFFTKWYQGWTGRFIYIPAAGALALGGPQLASVLPPITIALWFGSLIWVALPGFKTLRMPQPGLFACVYGGFFLMVMISTTPNLFQSVFWKDGLINYSLPLIGMTLSIGLMLRILFNGIKKTTQAAGTILIFICAFISGGFSEIFSTTQVAVYAILMISSLLLFNTLSRKRMLPVFIAGLLGSLCAYAIVLAAPGNLVRQDLISGHPNLVRLVTFSLRNALVIIVKYFVFTPHWALFSMLIPFIAGFSLWGQPLIEAHKTKPRLSQLWEQTWFKAGLTLPVMASIFTVAACAPVVYMLNAYPDDRSIIIPLYFIVAAVTISSGLFGFGARKLGLLSGVVKINHLQQISLCLLILLLLGGVSLSITNCLSQLENFQDYTAKWDQRHQQLAQMAEKGDRDVTVFGLENRFGISDLRVEADYWVNRCMAEYYGFSSITGQ